MQRQTLVTRHGEGLWQIRVPVPFPLRWVNAYVLQGDDGIAVVDPGLHDAASLEAWEAAMADIGFTFRDIGQIVLTHHHPDHLGLAGLFQDKSGAPVRLSPEGTAQMQALWGEGQPMSSVLLDLFARHGMDEPMLTRMGDHLAGFVPLVSPLPEVTPLHPEETVVMGGRSWRTIHAPGHALGQLLFLDEASGDLLCGDQVLPAITPNVSLLPGFGADPLRSFLASLEALAALRVERAFPGHRDPYGHFSARCDEIVRHHRERLARLAGMAEAPATAFELCLRFFGDQLSVHQLRFALGETLAHLVYLDNEGVLRVEESAGKQRWMRNV